ncbi:MAG: sulfite exporter TauE/SafE family protein [Gammaproteobacteria bacterium]|nr:sulfite exporter TauE/SafE family protein [Gammaproteobacteria bacterium]
MQFWQELLLFIAGVAAGYINVMAGGGSLLTVPVMVFMGLPAPVANGTNRIAILAQSITACWVFFRKGLSELRLSITLSLFTLPGALLGAHLGVRLEGVWFNRLLAAIMLMVMVLMTLKRKPVAASGSNPVKPGRYWLTHILMLFVGFYGGLIQVGVGFIIMPILHRVMGLDLLRVNMHKVFLVMPFTLVSLAVFISSVSLEWMAGLFLALGMATGGWLSTHIMIRKGEGLIRIVFNLALLVIIIKLLFFTG